MQNEGFLRRGEVRAVTRQELKDRLWRECPRIRRTGLRKSVFDRVADAAINRCPLLVLRACQRDGVRGRQLISDGWRESVRQECRDEYGFSAILLLFLAPVVGWLVTKLLDWWFESDENKACIYEWKREHYGI